MRVHTKVTSCNFLTLKVIIVAKWKIKNTNRLEMTNRIAYRIDIWNLWALVEHNGIQLTLQYLRLFWCYSVYLFQKGM